MNRCEYVQYESLKDRPLPTPERKVLTTRNILKHGERLGQNMEENESKIRKYVLEFSLGSFTSYCVHTYKYIIKYMFICLCTYSM